MNTTAMNTTASAAAAAGLPTSVMMRINRIEANGSVFQR